LNKKIQELNKSIAIAQELKQNLELDM